jgi:hypothetical protein
MLAAGLVDALVGVAEALLRRRVCRAMPAAVRGSESHNEGFITPVPERGVISTYIWKDVKSESGRESLRQPASAIQIDRWPAPSPPPSSLLLICSRCLKTFTTLPPSPEPSGGRRKCREVGSCRSCVVVVVDDDLRSLVRSWRSITLSLLKASGRCGGQ